MSEMTIQLPELNCGLCGFKTCADLARRLDKQPDLIKRCIHLAKEKMGGQAAVAPTATPRPAASHPLATTSNACGACGASCSSVPLAGEGKKFVDSLGRDFDFYLEHFPRIPDRVRSSFPTIP
jgi:hypothetical protein